jgi:hypothetical protein
MRWSRSIVPYDAAAGARRDAAWSCVGTTKTGAVSRAGRMGRLRVQMYTYIYTVDAGTVARAIPNQGNYKTDTTDYSVLFPCTDDGETTTRRRRCSTARGHVLVRHIPRMNPVGNDVVGTYWRYGYCHVRGGVCFCV